MGTNELKILNNVNISFPSKGFVSILGKSGCGKSTFLNLIEGIDKPNKGIIKYKNKDINKFNNKELKRYQNKEIGILFQHFNLFDGFTALENVIIPLLISGKNKKAAIKIADSLFVKFKITHLRDRLYKNLSGGEKQRVGLIRCLINNPSVIIADEPTGALDSKNSIVIMDELKEVSKNKLVILVTHNIDLSKKYNDYEINFNNKIELGCLHNDELDNSNTKGKPNNYLIWSFIKLHMKKDIIRNSIVILSISFSSLCSLLAFGYIKGSSSSREIYTKKSMLYNTASISKKKIIDVPSSPIKISKLSRPDLVELEFFKETIPSIKIKNNYETIFPQYPLFNYLDKEISDINFSSYYIENKSLLKYGRFPNEDSFNEVIVNEEFMNNFNLDYLNCLGSFIKLDFVSSIINNYDKRKIKDEICFSNSLKIVGVVSEFSYLNEPRVYYPYKGLELYLKGIKINNYSKELGTFITANEIVEYADSTDINSSYSYLIFIDNLNEVNTLKEYKKKFDISNEYEISSINFTISESYNALVDIITTSLILFLVLIIIATILIIVISSYSSYIQNKKESAILSILGLERTHLFFIYNFENLIITLLGFIFSCILFVPFKNIANNLIYSFARLDNAINIGVFSITNLIIIVVLMLISTLSSFVPFLLYDKNYILEEVKDE